MQEESNAKAQSNVSLTWLAEALGDLTILCVSIIATGVAVLSALMDTIKYLWAPLK